MAEAVRPTIARFWQPAEWAPHEAVWVAWPSAADLWREQLAPAQEAFVAMCEAIADRDPETGDLRGERIELLVPDEARRQDAVKRLGALAPRVHAIAFGDIWLRDTAPIFVRSETEKRAACFDFNGWGGKYVLEGDDQVAREVARAAELPRVRHHWILEGGSVDVDGEGTLLTTRQCLLNPNRNPGLTETLLETRLSEALGAERVLWLGDGLLHDHTDGHVDTIARFVKPGVVVCMEPSDDADPNAKVLRTILRDLEGMTDAAGRSLEVLTVPSPGRVVGGDGEIVPASYVNFYIANRAVVVPTYGSPHDDEAVRAIASMFPGRKTVGIDARAILSGGGAFHCITQQEPLVEGR
jgi:agmatine deiminase